MLNPIRLCYDLFDTKELSDSDLRTFTEDALIRLTNNNPGAIYSPLILETTNKFNAYYGKMSSETTQSHIKEGLTVTKQKARSNVEDKISNLQGLIKYKFGEGSDVYKEFYPQGMDAFYKAKDGDLELLQKSFVDSANTHLLADYPDEVTLITNLALAFKNAFAAQNNAFSLIDNIITGKKSDRSALTAQLTTNLLIIASNNVDNPEKFNDFFDTAYLPITEGVQTFNGIVNKNSTITAVPEGKITHSSSLLIENKGGVDFIVSISDKPEDIDPVNQLTIPAGQKQRIDGDLPVLTKYFLNIQNKSTDENGSWHVEVS